MLFKHVSGKTKQLTLVFLNLYANYLLYLCSKMPGVFISSTIICFMKCHSKAIRKTWLFDVLFFKKSSCIFWVKKNTKILRARFSAEASEPSPTAINFYQLHRWPEAFKMQFLGFCAPLPAMLAF